MVEPITGWKVLFLSKKDGEDIAFASDSGCYGARKRGTTLTRNWLRGVEYGEVFWLDRN